jgi:hypothetical protein
MRKERYETELREMSQRLSVISEEKLALEAIEYFDEGNGIGYSLSDSRPLGRIGIKVIEAKDVPAVNGQEVRPLMRCAATV